MEYKITNEGVGEDRVNLIEGECGDCHSGDNSLIITNYKKLSAVRSKVWVQCICCGTAFTMPLDVT